MLDRKEVFGLLFLYKNPKADANSLAGAIPQSWTGEAIAIIGSLKAKGYIVEDAQGRLSVNPLFNNFKNDFGISLSGTLGERTGVYTNPVFTSRFLQRDPNLCFVLIPFRQPFQALYEDHIAKVVTKLGFTCRKADELFGTTEIIEDVWTSIYAAAIVIADLTDRNPNVFYEIGIAHTLGRPLIMLTQSFEDVPFDLRHLRYINYEFTPRGTTELEIHLEKSIHRILELGIGAP